MATTSLLFRGKTADEKKAFQDLSRGAGPFDGSIYQTKDGQFMSTEVVAKVSESCVVLGLTAGDDGKKLDRFKSLVTFEDAGESLSH